MPGVGEGGSAGGASSFWQPSQSVAAVSKPKILIFKGPQGLIWYMVDRFFVPTLSQLFGIRCRIVIDTARSNGGAKAHSTIRSDGFRTIRQN